MRKVIILSGFLILFAIGSFSQTKNPTYRWNKLSTEYGDLPLPNKGKVQVASIAADFTKNGKDEFIIVENTESNAVIMYVHIDGKRWEKHEIDKRKVNASEAIAVADIDNDGDLDLCVGGEGKEIWWWENPYPNFSAGKAWKRYYIKRSGSELHNDLAFGDFDGDKELDIAFWNQGENALYVAHRPKQLDKVEDWPRTMIYSYSTDGQMNQHTNGTELDVRGINYHKGIGVADINGDGTDDIMAGGMWFSFQNDTYISNPIDGAFTSAKIQAAQLIPGGRPEVVMVSGDGTGPLLMYQYMNGNWKPTVLQNNLRRANSLVLIDFDKDGDVDILSGEMRTVNVSDTRVFLLLNDGNGNFSRHEVDSGKCVHMLSAGDFNGDGRIDLVGKPYTWDTPRIDVWINDGMK